MRAAKADTRPITRLTLRTWKAVHSAGADAWDAVGLFQGPTSSCGVVAVPVLLAAGSVRGLCDDGSGSVACFSPQVRTAASAFEEPATVTP